MSICNFFCIFWIIDKKAKKKISSRFIARYFARLNNANVIIMEYLDQIVCFFFLSEFISVYLFMHISLMFSL